MDEVATMDNHVEDARFCPSCGRQRERGTHFCAGCGRVFLTVAQAQKAWDDATTGTVCFWVGLIVVGYFFLPVLSGSQDLFSRIYLLLAGWPVSFGWSDLFEAMAALGMIGGWDMHHEALKIWPAWPKKPVPVTVAHSGDGNNTTRPGEGVD